MLTNPENLLIIRPGALGDTLMLLPLLAALRGVARVTAAVRRPGLDILRPHAALAALCLDLESGGRHALFEDEPDRASDLFGPRPGRVLAFVNEPDGRVAGNLGRLFPKAHSWVFPGRPLQNDKTHAALYLLQCAARAGLPVDPEASVALALSAPLLKPIAGCGEPCGVVFHPGSGGRGKNLPPAFWHGLIDGFAGARGWAWGREITVLLGPAEEGLGPEFEERALTGQIRVVSSPDTSSLVSLLGTAGFYAGHDSGVTHLAAMLGTPTAALFKGTDPQVWRPLGPKVQVIKVRDNEGPEMLDKVLSFAAGLCAGISRLSGPKPLPKPYADVIR